MSGTGKTMALRATEFGIFVARDTFGAVLSGGVSSWLQHYTNDWRDARFGSSCCPQQEVPCKRVQVTSSGTSKYSIALYSYCFAAKKTMVS